MRIVLALVALCFAFVTVTGAEEHLPVNLMPVPAHLQANSGQLTIDPSFSCRHHRP